MKKLNFLWLLFCCVFSIAAKSQTAFTPGNIVVSRIGTGTASLTDTLAPIFLDEYSPSGVLIQSISLPVTGLAGSDTSKMCLLSPWEGTMGASLKLSSDGRYLVLMGINGINGYSQIFTNPTLDRTIARIDYNAHINTTTTIPQPTAPQMPFCAITNDGVNFWTDNGFSGLFYTTLNSSSPTKISTNNGQTSLGIFDGQLYSNRANARLGKVGTGLPVTSGQTVVIQPGFTGLTGNQTQFFMADLDPGVPGVDVLYITNDEDEALQKFSLVGGTWVSNGKIGNASDDYTGITGVVNGSTVTIYCTRKIGMVSTAPGNTGEIIKLVDNSGYNSSAGIFAALPVALIATATANTVFRGISFAPQAPALHVSAKVYLQGAYSTALGRNKDVTANWAAALNTGALFQPYNSASFGNYNGSETKTAGFFASNPSPINEDIVDWVLVELRDATTPTTVKSRRAAFVREDGKVVDLDGVSDVTFPGIPAGNYYIVIRHRNHLSVRSANAVALNELPATTYDFTTAQSQAYQDPAITTNAAMKDLGGGVFGMWGGNANSNTSVRSVGGTATLNDFLYLSNTALGGNLTSTLGPPTTSPVYNSADLNMDGSVRAVGGSATTNDLLYLWNIALSGNVTSTLTAHQ